jgi:thiosulfate dehydrogenase [quinone] large subunit
LILGAFVGLAAAGGLLMNMAFLLAGTTSTNPVLAILGVLLILAWKNAGYIGLDRYLLPMLGTPWKQPKPTIAVATPKPVPVTS